MCKQLPILILLLLFTTSAIAQSPFISETLIKYDMATHKTDKPIPFDRSFTLVLDKFKSGDVTAVHIYEATMIEGNRFLTQNIYKTSSVPDNCSCKVDKELILMQKLIQGDSSSGKASDAIVDKTLKFKSDTSALMIFVDPLKPNKIFDFNIISHLTEANKTLVYDLNSQIRTGDTTKITSAFQKLKSALTDKVFARTYFQLDAAAYQKFYDANFAATYQFFSDPAALHVVDFPSLQELQAIQISAKKEKKESAAAHYFVEAVKNNYGDSIQQGLIDIAKVYMNKEKTKFVFGHTRIKNLKSSLYFLDSLHQRIDWLITQGYDSVKVNTQMMDTESLRIKLKLLRENMEQNLKLLSDKLDEVSVIIDKNAQIRQGTYLGGQTVSSDLKTAGGSVLFVDAGLTNIFAAGLNDAQVYIPRLYTGVTVYFRPIDKSTRQSSFAKSFKSSKNCGCLPNGVCGPDYGVISKASIWQHLGLNIGITWGAIPNKDFDNFYNNASLLLGPAFRFKRAFKLSAGAAFLKRSSKSPVVSEKKVLIGQYVSLSVDVDFIQSIKDVTSILFK